MGDNYFLLTNLLSEDERKVITSIASHIERGEKRVGIQQIASENFLSTTSIVKMCKRLGFDGYSELYYHLSRQLASSEEKKPEDLKSLIDNYDDTLITRFCALLMERRSGKVFTTGEGTQQQLFANRYDTRDDGQLALLALENEQEYAIIKHCFEELKAKLAELKLQQHAEKISDLKGVQLKIEWGSQIRNYVFMPYTLVKDTRTGFETSNINAVMDGDLDGFINAYLTCAATNTWVTKS